MSDPFYYEETKHMSHDQLFDAIEKVRADIREAVNVHLIEGKPHDGSLYRPQPTRTDEE